MRNPLDIKPGTVYLTGPDKTANGHGNSLAFAQVECRLQELGYEVVSAYSITYYNLCEIKEKTRLLNKRICHLAMCETVVTLPGWEKCPEAQASVYIARMMEKPVIFSEVFEKYHQNKQLLRHAG